MTKHTDEVRRIADYLHDHVMPELKGQPKNSIGTAFFGLGLALLLDSGDKNALEASMKAAKLTISIVEGMRK